MRRGCSLVLEVLVCVLLARGIALAQVTQGTILGTVSDSSGGVIPGVNVVVRNVETGISRTVTTDAAGRFRAPQLGLGSYEVTAEAAGFQTAVRTGITLTVGREAVVDFSLQVGAVAERITVTGEAPLIETTKATVSSLVDERTMRAIPLVGRSMADLTALQPGVVSDLPIGGGLATFTSVFSGGGHTRRSIGGTKPQQSASFLDGLETVTGTSGMPVNSVLGDQLGVDAIREFIVLSGNYGAQYGRAAGGVVNAITKSGSNEFHGGVFEFLRNEKLDARDYFLDRSLSKAPLKRNQFGAFLGGPIIKDRLFFFANYEGVRQAAAEPRIGSTLTAETRAGRLTGCPAGRSSCSPQEAVVTQTLPVNPDIKVFFPLIPLPNRNYRGAGTADLVSAPRWSAHENYGTTRMDFQLSENDSLFGRLTIDRSGRTDQLEQLTPVPMQSFQDGRYAVAAISETHIFSPTVLNTFRIGFTRRNDHLWNPYTERGDQYPDAPGLDPRLSSVKGIPLGEWIVPGVSLYGGVGVNLVGVADYVDNIFAYDDSIIISKGRHSITIGGNMSRYRTNMDVNAYKFGRLSWQTIERFLTNRPFNTVQYVGTHVPGQQKADFVRGYRQTYGAVYFQDDYRVLPNLTLNLGLRWEKLTGPTEANGKIARFENYFQGKEYTTVGEGGTLFDIRDGLKGWAPRFGFAWTPFGEKTVLRGGLGTFYDVPLAHVYRLNLEVPEIAVRYVPTENDGLKFPFPFENLEALSTATEPGLISHDLKRPYVIQWTFSVERQLGETFVAKANYIGTRGVNQFSTYKPTMKPTQIVNGRHFTPADAQTLNPDVTGIRLLAPISSQHYHAAQFVLEKRFSEGLRFNLSHTWSKNIDFGGGSGTECVDSVSGTDYTNYNQWDMGGDKGHSALHVGHNFIASYTYELPFGAGRRWGSQWSGVVNHILGGWSVSGTNSLRTGLPVHLGMTPRQSRCVESQCPERPDLKPGGSNNPVLENWTPERYFDPSNFVVPQLGFFGNVGRNTLIRPGGNTWNFSFSKDNRFTENINLEFRAEFFNILNHPNFGTPGGNVFRTAAGGLDPNVGRITSTSTSMRRIQFGLKLTF